MRNTWTLSIQPAVALTYMHMKVRSFKLNIRMRINACGMMGWIFQISHNGAKNEKHPLSSGSADEKTPLWWDRSEETGLTCWSRQNNRITALYNCGERRSMSECATCRTSKRTPAKNRNDGLRWAHQKTGHLKSRRNVACSDESGFLLGDGDGINSINPHSQPASCQQFRLEVVVA